METLGEEFTSSQADPDPLQGAVEEQSRWPNPIPEEWRQGRAANADEWFQQQKEELHRRYLEGKQALLDQAAEAAAAAAASAAYDARVDGMVKEQQVFSRSVQQQLSVLRERRLQANLEYQALRLPHFTPPRPLALITAPEGGTTLVERLFNRALATTLMTAVAPAVAGGGSLSSPESAGGAGEVVWCELGQSRVSMQDPPLARAEALERCRMALVILSPALQASPEWAIEKRILTARLAAPPGVWPGAPLSAVVIVRLHVPPPASVGAAAAAKVAGLGRKAAAAVAAATAAAAAPDPNPPAPLALPVPVPGYPVQKYPLTVMDMTVPLPADPPLEGAAAGTALAQSVRDAVATVLHAAASSGSLRAAGLCLLPETPPVHLHPAHVHSHPDHLLATSYGAELYDNADALAVATLTATLASTTLGAALTGAGSSGSLATQLLASPARAAVAAGPAATAAHLLPSSYKQRAVEDWTMYDTTMWLSSLGRSLERWSPGFLALAVDGPLLAVADDDDLRAACGVGSDKAVGVMRDSLNSALRRPSEVPPARALLPRPDEPASPLPPEAAVMPQQQRAALLGDIIAYYDQDHSGDLNLEELNRLLLACGMRLSDVRLKDVLDDYDEDSDGRLSCREAEAMLDDIWRLVMAQQDVAAWTPSETTKALKDAVDISWPLETPRATPDADKAATGTAARSNYLGLDDYRGASPASSALPSRGGVSDAGSDAASINIIGGAVSRAATTAATRRIPPPAANAPPRSAASVASPRSAIAAFSIPRSASRSPSASRRPLSSLPPPLVEGEDETGARVRLVDRTYSMAANRGSAVTTGAGDGTADGEANGSGGGGGSGNDDDGRGSVTSYRTYGWGLPPRLPLAATISMAVRRHSETSSISSDRAPWAGAITPRTARSGGKHSLSPEEMAARDIDVQRLLRRERTDAEIQESLLSMLDPLDLRRKGRVELQMLRASLASSGPPNQLSPLHTQLLSDIAEGHARLPGGTASPPATFSGSVGSTSFRRPLGRAISSVKDKNGSRRSFLSSGPLGEVLLGLEVSVQPYVRSAVQTVVTAQSSLMEVVYGDRGMSPMLRQLYRQTTGPDDPLELMTRGPRVQAEAAEAALEALMEVQNIKATALIRAALLPSHQLEPEGLGSADDRDEDPRVALAAAAAAGAVSDPAAAALLLSCGPTPLSLHSARRYPQSWASATAHMLHVYQVLLRRCS